MSDKGFSLVELSIVLVILGLLVGGVLGGQSLIKAAEMRAITTELQAWQTASNAFKDKYRSLAGDTDIATRVWGNAGAVCADVEDDDHTTPLGAATCNGNKDGRIGQRAGGADRHYERFLFWQHLSKAGMIPGDFTGVRGTGSSNRHVAGENAPASRYNGGVWMVLTNNTASGSRFEMPYINTFVFGAAGTGAQTTDPLLTPEEAWNIDSKIDDGKPGRGNVVAWFPLTCADAGTNTDYDSEYRLADTTAQCSLIFLNAI